MQSNRGFIYNRKLLLSFGNLASQLSFQYLKRRIFIKINNEAIEEENCFDKNAFSSVINQGIHRL